MPPIVLATDNFNRADNTDTGTNWTVISTMVRFGIVSNAAAPSDPTGSDDGEYYNALTPPNGCYAKAKVTINANPADASFNGCGVGLRSATGATTFYVVLAIDDRIKLFLMSAGTPTLLGTSSQSWVDGTELKIEAINDSIKAYIGGSATAAISATNATLTSGRFCIIFGTTSGASGSLDDWEGGYTMNGETVILQAVKRAALY